MFHFGGLRNKATFVRRTRLERGAAAVEFALISLILMPLALGIVAYGLWFNDSLNVRQGVREGARAGVVKNFSATGCTGHDMAVLACKTKRQIGAVTGDSYVKISTPEGWTKAGPLVVCAMVKSNVGIAPLPNHGVIQSRTEMAIEITDSLPNALSYTDTVPAGLSWSWCP
jgi:Flp pilus assembly pilin Flp